MQEGPKVQLGPLVANSDISTTIAAFLMNQRETHRLLVATG